MYIKKRFESKNEQVGGKTTCYVDFLPDGSKKRNVLCSIEHPFNSSDLKFYPGLNWIPNLKAKAWTFASPVKADRVRSRIEMWVAQFRGNILTIDEFIENVNGIEPKNEAAPPESEAAPDAAKVASPKDTQINTANAVRDFLATYLRNELEDSVDLDYAVRTYDDVYPYLEVVDKDMPGTGSYLTLYVYSPLGDGNFKIAYKYFEHPNNRIDCPTNVTGLEAVAKMFAMLVLGKSAVKESSGFDDYLAQFKEEFETQWGPYGWEKAYALILNTESWLQFIKDNWANNDYDPAEMAEYAIETWFNDESKSESSYEKLEYEKGHKNSKGEDAPWVIRRRTDGRILASFSDKDAGEA